VELFQSTPLREGRPADQGVGITAYLFQSTPLREGRHQVSQEGYPDGKVSIHAPA